MTNVKLLVEDPAYLAYRLDFQAETIEYIALADGDLSKATWLNRESLGAERPTISVPLAEVVDYLGSVTLPPRQIRFIFHTAYSASTFLSRCLDVEGVSVSLREPQLILDAANAKRIQWTSQSSRVDYRHLPALALALLGKHAPVHQTLIIKPINSVNNIIPELLHASGSAKSLMMYTDARNFLLSTFKKGEEARQTIRSMFDLLRCDFQHLVQLSISDVVHMSDLKVCLTLWRLQLEQAEQILKSPSVQGRMASLYAENLIMEPLGVLYAANRFLEINIPDDTIEGIATSGLLAQDAKNTEDGFSLDKRNAVYEKIEAFYGADLDNGYKWLISNNPSTVLEPVLSNALLRE